MYFDSHYEIHLKELEEFEHGPPPG